MKKPFILITTSNVNSSNLESVTGDTEILYSDKATASAVIKAGGIPLYLPTSEEINSDILKQYIDIADGILISGADTNTNPIYYGENPLYLKSRIDDERDKVDIKIVKMAYDNKLPILGICKGMQIINVALGGTLYQNILAQHPGSFDHDIKKTSRTNYTHKAHLKNGSILKKIVKKDTLHLNGGHEQAIKNISNKLIATAVADDGIIESIEGIDTRYILGVQFHPELRLFDINFFGIFKHFIKQCKIQNSVLSR